jgi:hypothetical protein
MAPPVRFAIWTAFRVARFTGLENRLLAFARATGDPEA